VETITPIVEKRDLVFIVSNTGTTMSAVQTANIARRVGASVVSITGPSSSKLGGASNIVMAVAAESTPDQAKYAPLATLFEDAALVLLDSVVAQVMEARGQTEEDMRARHAIMV
jgi:6-phospho-3-hexuloisomerase